MATIELDEPDDGPVPEPLVAVTRKLYVVPEVSPATVQGEAAQVADSPPGLEVTV